jgi:hypothetical protein
MMSTTRIDLSKLEPLIAKPSSPGNVVPVKEIEGEQIYQAYIGSSANPGWRDFAIAAGRRHGESRKGPTRVARCGACPDFHVRDRGRARCPAHFRSGAANDGRGRAERASSVAALPSSGNPEGLVHEEGDSTAPSISTGAGAEEAKPHANNRAQVGCPREAQKGCPKEPATDAIPQAVWQ